MLHCAATYAGHLRHRPPSDARLGRPTWKPHHDSTQDVRPASREILPHQNLDVLRGIEGARMKRTYQTLSQRYGITWRGRRYDRGNPLSADIPNQAINHASVAVTAAAVIAGDGRRSDTPAGFHPRTQRGGLCPGRWRPVPRHNPSARRPKVGQGSDGRSHSEHRTAHQRTTGELLRTERVISKMIDRNQGPLRRCCGPHGSVRVSGRSGKGSRSSGDRGRYRQRRGALPGVSRIGDAGDSPGGYTAPQMTSGIRDRIWDVLADWYYELGQARS